MMNIPMFDRHVEQFICCQYGVNGDLPTELSSRDILENVESILGLADTFVAVVPIAILSRVLELHKFISYGDVSSSIRTLFFENEFGVLGNIRFVLDPSLKNCKCTDSQHKSRLGKPIYDMFIFEPEIVKEDENYSLISKKHFNLMCTR